MGIEDLEKMAVELAREAYDLDTKGSPFAVEKYQRAVEILQKLANLYPSRVYLEFITIYQRRIEEIKTHGPQPVIGVEKPSLDQFVLAEKPNVKWGEVADLEEAKQAIQESIVWPYKRPDVFPLGWPTGILLYGPPGCGKTLLAAAVATEIDATFFCVDAASLMSKWLGDSEKNVAQMFRVARSISREGRPVIIYIDEVDSLLGIRSTEVGGEVRARNQFLEEMDGITSKKTFYHIHVISSTNCPWMLDRPFIRRFQKRIYIPLPNYDARLQLFNLYTKHLNLATDVNMEELVRATEGYSGSDIRDICQSAHMKVLRSFFESGGEGKAKLRPVCMEDFIETIKERKPSVSKDLILSFERWTREFGAL